MDKRLQSRFTVRAAGLLLTAPVWLTAQAQQGTPTPFGQIDKDADGYIVLLEAEQGKIPKEQFTRADRDRDQRLSRTEYETLSSAAAPSGGGQAAVTVQEQPGKIIVQKQPPEVTVRQQPPQVTVVQPNPQVNVQPAEPQVQVQTQGQPQVQVEKSQEKPKVTVVQPDQQGSGGRLSFQQLDKDSSGFLTPQELKDVPQLGQNWQQYDTDKNGRIEQAEFAAFQSSSGSQGGEPAGSSPPAQGQSGGAAGPQGALDPSLRSLTAEQLTRKDVYNQQGEQIGEVESLVSDVRSNRLHAVVAGGGFLGIGEERMAVALDQLRMDNDRLVLKTPMTEDQLKQATYQADNYRNLESTNTQLGQLAQQQGGGQQQGGTTQLSFQGLDRDSSGYLTPAELAQHPQLSRDWQQYDRDGNGQIEQAEFAAFQASSGQQGK